MNYFLIPGNPPAIQFYESWRAEIEGLGLGSRVKVSAYPDFSKQSFTHMDSELFMQEILAHHLNHLSLFQQEVIGPVTLIGHSLGGYFAWRMLEAADDQMQNVVLVHPFLRAPDFRGQALLQVARMFALKPAWARDLVRIRKWLNYFSKDLTLVSDQEILSAVQIAFHEQLWIANDRSPIKIAKPLQERICAFYTQNDIWCGPTTIRDLRAQVQSFACTEPHGFVTESKHRQSLFAKIEKVLAARGQSTAAK